MTRPWRAPRASSPHSEHLDRCILEVVYRVSRLSVLAVHLEARRSGLRSPLSRVVFNRRLTRWYSWDYRLVGLVVKVSVSRAVDPEFFFFFSDRQPCRSDSVQLMPQIQPSGRGLLPSPTAWSPDQHLVAMLADVSRHILSRPEGRGLGFGQLVRTHTGSSSDGHSDHSALCSGG